MDGDLFFMFPFDKGVHKWTTLLECVLGIFTQSTCL